MSERLWGSRGLRSGVPIGSVRLVGKVVSIEADPGNPTGDLWFGRVFATRTLDPNTLEVSLDYGQVAIVDLRKARVKIAGQPSAEPRHRRLFDVFFRWRRP